MAEGPRVSANNVFKIAGSYAIIPSEPLAVGSEHQLLMDHHVVDDAWNCRRTVHEPKRYSDEPVIAPEKPWEGIGPGSGQVWRDPDTGTVRLLAAAHHPRHYLPEKKHKTGVGVYYESADGIHWERPNLGLIEFDGSRENNLV